MADLIAGGNHKAYVSELDQTTCDNIADENFWSIMKNKAINAHLKQQAYMVADLIAGQGGSLKKNKCNIDQQTCEHFDKNSFWSIMEDETMCTHIKKEANKVADGIAKEWGNPKTCLPNLDQMSCENMEESSFWSIMKNEDMHAHLKAEANKVVSLIRRKYIQTTSKDKKAPVQNIFTLTGEEAIKTQTRHEASNEVISMSASSQDSPSRVEVQSPAAGFTPQLSLTSNCHSPHTKAKPSQTSVRRFSPRTDEYLKQLQTLSTSSPGKSLNQIFKLLSSDDWQKKIDGLTSIQDLARNHPEVLKATLRKVCLAVMKEVQNLRSLVSCTAMATLGEMYAHLQRAMDDMVAEIGRLLMLKASDSNAFIQQQANLTLDTMVQNCSPGRTMRMLLNAGLSHRSAAARTSAAQHLSQLYNILGATRTLAGGKNFTKCFLIAVSRACVDAAAEVRRHGYDIVHNICAHSAFQRQWKEAIPEKDRQSLEGVIRKLKQQKEAAAQDCNSSAVVIITANTQTVTQ